MTFMTLDLRADEALLLVLILNSYVDEQLALLREETSATKADEIRIRLEIATSVRGNLPHVHDLAQAIHVQRGEPEE